MIVKPKKAEMSYLYCFHQTLNFKLIQDWRNWSGDDVHRYVMNLLDVVRVNRPVVGVFIAGLSGHGRLVSTG